MNKTGQSMILIIFELIAVVIVILLTTGIAKSLGSSDSVTRTIIIEDLRLMTNTLIGVPGDAIVQYPVNVSPYTIVMGPSSVVLFPRGQETQKMKRTYSAPDDYRIEGFIDGETPLCLEKKGRTISLKKCLPEPDIYTRIAEPRIIIG